MVSEEAQGVPWRDSNSSPSKEWCGIGQSSNEWNKEKSSDSTCALLVDSTGFDDDDWIWWFRGEGNGCLLGFSQGRGKRWHSGLRLGDVTQSAGGDVCSFFFLSPFI
jgi:hypothetical protein